MINEISVQNKQIVEDQSIVNYCFNNLLNENNSSFVISQINQQYELLKENFRDSQNFYLNYFYNFFGEHYESIINNVNFFHFASEAIILEILKIKNYSELINSESDSEFLIEKIKLIEIDPHIFYENLRFLTGTFYIYDSATKLSEMKLAKIFLEKFNQIKNSIKSPIIISNNNFSEILIKILHLSTSHTIIELNLFSIPNCELTIDFLYNCYQEFISTSNKNLVLINFIKIIQTNSSSQNIMKDKSILNILKLFYFYTKTKFEDYIYDLSLFNNHSTSLIEKVKIISKQNFQKINSNLNKILKDSKPFENLKSFYSEISNKLEVVGSNMHLLKKWIDESISMNYSFYDSYKISKIFIYDKILTPSKNFLVLSTDKYVTFIMTNLTNVNSSMKEISNFFLDKANLFMNNLENKINESELCLRFTMDERINFIKVDVENTVVMINSKKFKKYVESIYEVMKIHSLDIYEKSKNYLRGKYKLFLGD